MTDDKVPTALSSAAARQIDRACDRFEAAWKAGRRPDPAEALDGATEPIRSALLRQILLLDWDYRYRNGERPEASDYRSRFPADAAVIAGLAEEMHQAAATHVQSRTDSFTSSSRGPTEDNEAEQIFPSAPDRYEMLQEVGHGGIGIVFRGRDRLLGREVAIKVLSHGYRDRPAARRLFVAEARVGSQLQHPAIVPVYELGRFGDGRPFITMKLIEGYTLAAMLRGRGRDPLADLPRFLAIFEQVCQAVAYAHSKGIVHRDLKPANVMVGAFGEVQVMDWGFAKVLADDAADGRSLPAGDTGGSRGESLMGTPAYMPPEQARGEEQIDPRADVFALGAILCEILTGRPPYTGDGADCLCERAATGDLAEARARLNDCSADPALRNLVLWCLAADRSDRPADAGVVCREMTAFIASAQERLREAEVKQAEADGRARAQQRGRRLLAGFSVALLAAAVAACWQAVAATGAKRDAQAAAVDEKRAKETANAREAETRATLEFFEKKVIAAARPKGFPGGLGTDVTVRKALEAAVPDIATSFADRPLIGARLRMAVAGSLFDLGERQAPMEQLEAAYPVLREHLGLENQLTLECLNDLACSYDALGRGAEAAVLHERILGIRRAKFGADNDETLESMNNLAMSYFTLERYDDAIRLHEQALAIKRDRFGPENSRTLTTLVNLANCYGRVGRQLDALKLRDETLAIQSRNSGRRSHDTLMTMNNLAANYRKLDRFADARHLDEETLAARKATLGPNHPETLASMWGLADDLIHLGHGGDAVPILDDCLRRSKGQRVHRNFPDVADLRLRHFQAARDAAGCRRTADRWEELHRTDADSLYEAAVCRAVTAVVIRATDPSPQSAPQVDAEAERAIAWLRQAAAADPKIVARIKLDKDFEVLGDRAAYRQLIDKTKPD